MAGAESYDGYIPLLRSTDGGQGWRWVDVPEPPGGRGKEPLPALAPDGALRFRTPADVTYSLTRRANLWTPA